MKIFFLKILMWLQIGLSRLVDMVMQLFSVFSGIETVKVDGKEESLLLYFLGNKTVTSVFWAILVIGVFCLFVFTTIAIIKNMVVIKKTVAQIISKMFISMFSMIVVVICLWNDVAHYVYRKYSMLNAKVHISGDGAYWIKYGQHIFHKAQYHIDKFHIQKSATAVAKGNRQVRSKILAAMRKRDYKSLKTVFQEQYLKYTERTERRTIAEQYFYLLNNMETYGIKNRCSAEGHVSHVLSDRMSSRPMGWSRAGAEQMAKLRAFYFNGGNFLDLIRYGKIAEDDMQEIYTTRYNSHVNAVKLGVAPTPAKVYSVASIAGQNTRISKLLRSLIKIK